MLSLASNIPSFYRKPAENALPLLQRLTDLMLTDPMQKSGLKNIFVTYDENAVEGMQMDQVSDPGVLLKYIAYRIVGDCAHFFEQDPMKGRCTLVRRGYGSASFNLATKQLRLNPTVSFYFDRYEKGFLDQVTTNLIGERLIYALNTHYGAEDVTLIFERQFDERSGFSKEHGLSDSSIKHINPLMNEFLLRILHPNEAQGNCIFTSKATFFKERGRWRFDTVLQGLAHQEIGLIEFSLK